VVEVYKVNFCTFIWESGGMPPNRILEALRLGFRLCIFKDETELLVGRDNNECSIRVGDCSIREYLDFLLSDFIQRLIYNSNF